MTETKAVCTLIGADGIKGVVEFVPVEGGTQVVGQVQDLPPGQHGFHVHQFGDTVS